MKPSDLTIKNLFNDEAKLTFLIGAGCSVDPPSCLPAGRSMMEAIINYTCAKSEIEKILELEDLRFEQVVEILRDNLDTELKIIDYYGQCDKPNLQHFFLADMIKKGHFVMTTNFDFLIEHALLQSNIPRDEIIPVITRNDFANYNNPINLFEKGKKPIYKIHGSTKNIITDENTRDSLVATIQAFGSNKGVNVFQVEPFKRPLFDNISNNRTLVVMGYSGSDDFDVVPTLMVLKNLKDVIWINFILDDGGLEKIFEINETTVKLIEKSNKVNQILAKICRMHNTKHIYRVDVNTTRLIDELIDSKLKPSSKLFSTNPMHWLKDNIKLPIEMIQYAIPYRIYSDFGLYQDSMRCSEKMLKNAEKTKNQSWKSKALYKIGKILYAQGNYSEALKRCEEALRIDEQKGDLSRKISYLVQIGLIFRAQGKIQKALSLFQDTLVQCKGWDRALCHKQIGEIYRNKGELDYALEEFQEALKIEEKLGDLSGKASSLEDIGRIYQIKGKTQESLKRYEDALKIHEQLGGLLGKINSLYIIAGIEYNQGNYLEALKKTEEIWEILTMIEATESAMGKAIKEDLEEIPLVQTAKSEISKIFTGLNLFDFEELDKIIFNKFQDSMVYRRKLKSPKFRDPKFMIPIITYMYFPIHGYKITKSELIELSDISDVDFNNFLIQLRNYLNSYDFQLKTIKILHKKLVRKPNDSKVWYTIGITLNKAKKYQDALEFFNEALNIDPDYKDAWNNRGVALGNLNRYQEALGSFDKVLALDPNYAPAWYNKACTESMQSNEDKALAYLRKAIVLDNKYKAIAKGDSDLKNIQDSQEFKELVKYSLESDRKQIGVTYDDIFTLEELTAFIDSFRELKGSEKVDRILDSINEDLNDDN